uniref:Uncharacterized protein n=1 Tax=Anguilla anguilla TaxID=7936 RepID=A0A0E9SDC5_ANGAN
MMPSTIWCKYQQIYINTSYRVYHSNIFQTSVPSRDIEKKGIL